MTTRGATLRYRLDGPPSGPVVVLGNSLGTNSSMWDLQVPRLAGFSRVLRYDQRGHGGSSAPPGPYSMADLGQDLVDLLDALGIGEAALCGLSLGGMTAMWVAAHHPGRVSSLVLACTAPELGPPERWHERAASVRAHGTGVLVEALFERWFPTALRAARPELRAWVSDMLVTCDPDGYASCCEAIAAMDLRPDLEAVRAPALVLSGAEDPVTTPGIGLELAGALGAGFVVVPDAGHLANIAAPAAFTHAVETHLFGTPVTRGMAVRRAVLGDAHVDRSMSQPNAAGRTFAEFLTRAAWGEVWSRPGLDRRARSIVTLSVLMALGRLDELKLHVPGALRNGLSKDEITELVLHCAVYGGAPAANSAMPVVLEVLEAADDQGDGASPAERVDRHVRD